MKSDKKKATVAKKSDFGTKIVCRKSLLIITAAITHLKTKLSSNTLGRLWIYTTKLHTSGKQKLKYLKGKIVFSDDKHDRKRYIFCVLTGSVFER